MRSTTFTEALPSFCGWRSSSHTAHSPSSPPQRWWGGTNSQRFMRGWSGSKNRLLPRATSRPVQRLKGEASTASSDADSCPSALVTSSTRTRSSPSTRGTSASASGRRRPSSSCTVAERLAAKATTPSNSGLEALMSAFSWRSCARASLLSMERGSLVGWRRQTIAQMPGFVRPPRQSRKRNCWPTARSDSAHRRSAASASRA